MLKNMILVAALAVVIGAAPAHAQPDWDADLQLMRQVLEETHPDFFAHLDRAAFEAAYDALDRDLDSLSDQEAIVRLAELVAMGRDGHTRLTLPLAPEADLFTSHRATEPPHVELFGQFPVRLRRAEDGYVMTQAAPELRQLLGARLISVDGVPIAAVEERLMPLIHGDNIHQQRNLAPSFLVVPEVLAALGVARTSDHATWRFQLANGSERAVRLSRRGSDEAIAWRRIEAPDAAPQSMSRTEDGVLIVRVAEIVESNPGDFARFSESLAQALAQAPPRAVLIDLRGNVGGDNSLIDPLVRVLVREGALWAPGRLFVATDGGTFSAAIQLTTALARWTPAIFIGEPTGGAPNHHGDAQRIVLPSSGLTLRVSSLYWQMTGPGDRRDAIAPLVDAPPRVDDIRSGTDPALRFVSAAARDSRAALEGRWQGRIALGEHLLGMQLSVGEALTMDIPDGFPTATLQRTRTEGALLEASGDVAGYPVVIRARSTDAGLIGHVELLGRLYAFVIQRAAG